MALSSRNERLLTHLDSPREPRPVGEHCCQGAAVRSLRLLDGGEDAGRGACAWWRKMRVVVAVVAFPVTRFAAPPRRTASSTSNPPLSLPKCLVLFWPLDN